jgi:hypothetical protein
MMNFLKSCFVLIVLVFLIATGIGIVNAETGEAPVAEVKK